MFFHDVDSNIFHSNDMGYNTIDNNILDDGNFGENDPETINHVRLMNWSNRFKQRKACKK